MKEIPLGIALGLGPGQTDGDRAMTENIKAGNIGREHASLYHVAVLDLMERHPDRLTMGQVLAVGLASGLAPVVVAAGLQLLQETGVLKIEVTGFESDPVMAPVRRGPSWEHSWARMSDEVGRYRRAGGSEVEGPGIVPDEWAEEGGDDES